MAKQRSGPKTVYPNKAHQVPTRLTAVAFAMLQAMRGKLGWSQSDYMEGAIREIAKRRIVLKPPKEETHE